MTAATLWRETETEKLIRIGLLLKCKTPAKYCDRSGHLICTRTTLESSQQFKFWGVWQLSPKQHSDSSSDHQFSWPLSSLGERHFKSKMKSALIFVTLISFALANDLFVGKWKEDQTKRQNLNDFLYYRGMLFPPEIHRQIIRWFHKFYFKKKF